MTDLKPQVFLTPIYIEWAIHFYLGREITIQLNGNDFENEERIWIYILQE